MLVMAARSNRPIKSKRNSNPLGTLSPSSALCLNLNSLLIQFLQRVPFAQQTAFWNAKVYRELKGFDISLKYVADSKFFFSILFNKKYKYKKINEYIAKFRWHSEGFSSAQKEMMNLESINMKKELSYFKNSLIMKTLVELFIKLYNLKNIIIKKLLNES